jgi:hypothetical protein
MSHDPLPPGLPCWNEIASADPATAKAFYRQVMGWEAVDQPMDPGGVYTLFRSAGREVAGCYRLRPEQHAVGVAPHWLVYLSVTDSHDAAARAGRLGGHTLLPPTEVPDMGRFAVVAAPGGALLGLWQDLTDAPWEEPPQAPGHPCWAELHTRDPQQAEAFYRGLVDWRAGEREYGGRSYTVLFREERPVASLDTDPVAPEGRDLWLPYFAVADAAAALAAAEAAGGRVARELRTVPGLGRYGVVQDPEGALFAVKELE